MSEFVYIGPQGEVAPETEPARARLAERAGRFYVAPTSPDLLIGVRAPCTGGRAGTPRVVLAGDLSGVPLADLVAFLNQSRLTGVLRVISPAGERAIVFKLGEVRGAASDDPADLIGEIAVRLGLLERARLDEVLASSPGPHRLGRVLVEKGLLQPHDLWRCLQHQVSEIFHAILLSQDGAFMLVDQEVEDRGGLAVSTQGLLMDAIRRIDEMKEFRKRLPSSRAYVVQVKPPSPKMEPVDHRLWELCDGQRTVGDIALAARLTEFDATKILHHLIEDGYVAASPTPAAPAPRQGPTPEEVVRVFNLVFKEIHAETRKVAVAAEFVAAANGAIRSQASSAPYLSNLSFAPDGTLNEKLLLANLARLGQQPEEIARTLQAALTELMFFLLFQTGELLDARADEDLSRRVKQILSTIEGA